MHMAASAPRGALRLVLSTTLLIPFAGPAVAQLPADAVAAAAHAPGRSNWVVTPSLKLAETYTDNVFLSPDGFQQSDWITQVIPGISVTTNGPRLRLDAFYAPEIVYYAQTEREEKVFHRGNATGTLELADELLFLEAGARVDQYDISLRGPLTTSNVNITGNRATAVTSYVSPYFLRDIGSAARAEARFTYSAWQSDEDQPALPDNTARRVLLRLTNGPAYRLFTWDVNYTGESIEYDTQQQTTTEEFTASGKRQITRAVSLLALAGYERYDTGIETLAEPRWSGGFEWTPVPRTRLAATAGRRLGDKTYSLQFDHRTRLSTWNVSYAEDVTTSREQFFVPATLSTAGALDQMLLSQYPDPLARQKAVQEFIARMGLPPSLAAPANFFSDQLFLQKRWLASAGLQGIRNTLFATAFWEERKELAGGTQSGLDDFVISQSIRTSGGNLAWGLRLTARTTWNLQGGYTRSQFLDTGQVDDFVYLQAGFTRQFQPRVSGSLHYRLQAQKSTQAGAEYRENAGVASLLMTI
jgi:uncharacterized protein (PEP-CTERM system associated)